MQKRTNPLELKVEKTAQPAPPTAVEPKDEAVNIPEVPPAPAKEETKPPLVKRVAPEAPKAETKTEVRAPSAQTIVERENKSSPMMAGNVTWQMVMPQKQQPAPTPVVEPEVEQPDEPAQEPMTAAVEETVAEPEVETCEQTELPEDEDDILGEPETEVEETVADEAEDEEGDRPLSEDGILDEEEPLSIKDYEMAARFSMCGRVSRGTKMCKMSKDLCRLAQLMHPEQSLGEIIEGALLSRIYLENREAFDALVVMLEKKGGHIKC